jgi:hypothetical protein
MRHIEKNITSPSATNRVTKVSTLPLSVSLLCLAFSPLSQGQDKHDSKAKVDPNITSPSITNANKASYLAELNTHQRDQISGTIVQTTVPTTRLGFSQDVNQQLADNLLPPLPTTQASAEKPWAPGQPSLFQDKGFDFSVKAESYTGRFDWSIASDMTGTRTPTILSELTYDALNINVMTYDYVKRFVLTQSLTGSLEVSYSKGGISEGTVYDADYYGNGRTDPKSLSASNPTGSDISARQASVSVSRRLSDHTHLAVLGGFAQSSQEFVKRQGVQMISARGANVPAVGTTFNNLDSSYSATWKSGFLGSQITYARGAHRLKLRAEFHGADYYAEADWNLRAAFQHPKSFEHLATGTGLNTKLSYDIAIDKNLSLSFSAHREHWQTRDGLDRVFLATGQTITTRLVETNWERTGYGIGITYVGGLR